VSAAALQLGAYGFRVLGVAHHRQLRAALVDAPDSWPAFRIRLKRGARSSGLGLEVDDDAAELGLPRGGRAILDRRSATATITTPAPLDRDWLVHPALACIAAVFARWHGRCSLHGGAFVAGSGAWGLLGGHEDGKSTTLARLSADGHPVLADDMLALDGTHAFAGPQTIDLRRSAAPHFVGDRPATTVRSGQRRRLTLSRAGAEYPLRGLFVLRWGDEVAVRRLGGAEAMAAMLEQMQPAAPAGARRALELLELPFYELRRPRRLEVLPDAAAEMLRVAESDS
jgi:hypothetical protein